MRKRTTTIITTLATAGLLAITGCDSNTNSSNTDQDGKPPAVRNTAKAGGAGTKTANLPDMKDKGLQSAQDQAQAAGFYNLTSHDALGRGRMQAFDRNWKVCGQAPKAGQYPADTKVDFSVVKLDESCVDKDRSEPRTAGSKMPDFTSTSVKAARTALNSGTSITVKDASGRDRMVLMESNWQVCSQQPAAGAELDGRPVTLTAVKFGESC
ncbi:hypothetical protein V7793_00220 [Streptomyces sp. KLMMK]|uniref:hypothetical protein n=1 Tax=Streptomyces sp. KLMMK TaxID=3109353 RepID=UPI003000237F